MTPDSKSRSSKTALVVSVFRRGWAALVAVLFFWIGSVIWTPSVALDFTCVEASRYRSLVQIFNGDRNAMLSHLGLESSQLPNMNSCRALAVSGSLEAGDAEKLLDQVIQGQGSLAVLYLSFGGTLVEEEIRIAHVIRGFWLKTRHLSNEPYRYAPDFVTAWGVRTMHAYEYEDYEKPTPFSPFAAALAAFSSRRDIDLPAVSNFCMEGCVSAWMAGVQRELTPVPPVAPGRVATGPMPELITASVRNLLLARLDMPDGVSPTWTAAPVVLGGLANVPPPVERILRQRCAAEYAAVEALETQFATATSELPRDGYWALRHRSVPIFGQLDALRTGGMRLQQCVARVYELERHASFRRQCPNGCDKAALLQAFNRSAREIIDDRLVLPVAGTGIEPGRLASQWQIEEHGGRGTWTRRPDAAVFDTSWSIAERQQTQGPVEIVRVGDRITALRKQDKGRCLYQGQLSGQAVRGTYTCFWLPGVFGWSATLRE